MEQLATLAPLSSLSEAVADQLAARIQDGTLPPGYHLVQTEMADHFGVSRVAVRDALKHLERRGLTVNVPRKGMIVRPLSEKAIRDLIVVMRTMDILAIGEAARRVTPEDLARLRRIVDEQEELARDGDYAAAGAKDEEFHLTIYETCDNDTLQDIVSYLWPRMCQARGYALVDTPENAKAWAEKSVTHHRVMLATLEGSEAGRRVLTQIMMEMETEMLEGLKAKR